MPVMFDITVLSDDMWTASLVSSEQYILPNGIMGENVNDSESDIFQQNLSAITIPCMWLCWLIITYASGIGSVIICHKYVCLYVSNIIKKTS